MSTGSDQPRPPAGGRPILSPLRAVAAVCLIAPFVAMLWIPSYNKTSPKLLGFPFFYWYQLLWVIITAVLMIVAFTAVNRDRAQRRGTSSSSSSASAAGGREGGDGTEVGQ
jgi:FtsH-binding integral membrane protein